MSKEPPNPIFWILSGLVLLIAGYVFFKFEYVSFSYWQHQENGVTRSEIFRNLGLLAVAIVGVVFAGLRWLNLNRQAAAAERQAEIANEQRALAERGLITDRINKAVENMGSDNSAVCMGGIRILWQIIREIPDHDKVARQQDVTMILDVLLGFIRAQKNFIHPGINNENWHDAVSFSETGNEPNTRNGSDDASSASNEAVPVLSPNIQMILNLFGGHSNYYRSILSEKYQVHLGGLDLRGASFNDHYLPYVKAMASDMSHAAFCRADLSNGTMLHVNFSDAILSNSRCEKTDFSYSLFKRTILNSTIFHDADFSYTTLNEVDFRYADCKNAKFLYAKSKGSNFLYTQFCGAEFISAKLDGENFAHSRCAEADFIGASLKEADFKNSSLQEAKFNGAFLHKADFAYANLTGADFREFSILDSGYITWFHKHIDLWEEGRIDAANMAEANLSDADLSAANLSGVNLSGVSLRGAILAKTKLYGTNLTGADLTDAKKLTQKQINSAVCEQDNPPKLPDGLTPPTRTFAEYKTEMAIKRFEENERLRSENKADEN